MVIEGILVLILKEMLSKFLLTLGVFGRTVYQVKVFHSLPNVLRGFGLITDGY